MKPVKAVDHDCENPDCKKLELEPPPRGLKNVPFPEVIAKQLVREYNKRRAVVLAEPVFADIVMTKNQFEMLKNMLGVLCHNNAEGVFVLSKESEENISTQLKETLLGLIHMETLLAQFETVNEEKGNLVRQ